MRAITRLFLSICVLFSFVIAESKDNQKVKWKGKIEKKDGIKVTKKITREYNPVRISEADKEETLKDIPPIPPGSKIEFKRYHPAFSSFKMDDQGRIFVQTAEKPDSGEKYSFDVFDSEGRYIAKIPLNFRPQVLKKGKIYTKEKDEEGYPFVKRYKVTWKVIK